MAGIGFELRKLLEKDTFYGILRAYTYAGLISSGPWIISILALLFLGIFTLSTLSPQAEITQFQTSVTFLIATSLIFTGPVQLSYNRFVADHLFMHHFNKVLPSFLGFMSVIFLASLICSSLVIFIFFRGTPFLYQILMIGSFTLLCNVWSAVVLLAGLKKYKTILASFVLGYGVIVIGGMDLSRFGLNGLLLAFLTGHLVLLSGIFYAIFHEYHSKEKMSFEFFQSKHTYWSLVLTGLLYNIALWADKFIFWFNPNTSEAVIGPLRYSPIYDFPIFLAYLSIIPGMAVFLVRMETDFVEYYQKLYNAILGGGSLSHIREMHSNLILTARQGIFEIMKVQAIAILVVFVMGPMILRYLGIPQLYIHLLNVDIVAVGLQVVFLGLLNICFYLDERMHAVILTGVFAVLNITFTQLSIHLGIYYFGYGFATSLLITVTLGMILLNYDFKELEYETFMLQR